MQAIYSKEGQMIKDFFGEDLCHLLAESGAILAGGAITSIFTGKEVNDWDIYFTSREGWSNFIREIYGYNEHQFMRMFEKPTVFASTKKSILLRSWLYKKTIQLIGINTHSSPADIFRSFDFTINMGAYLFEQDSFYFHPNFLMHNAKRELHFNPNTSFPLISAMRSKKYEERGYTISTSEMYKILLCIANKNIDSWDELEKELGGMYGFTFDGVFKEEANGEFNLLKAVDLLSNFNFRNDVDFDETTRPSLGVKNFGELIETFDHMFDDATKEWFKSCECGGRPLLDFDNAKTEKVKLVF